MKDEEIIDYVIQKVKNEMSFVKDLGNVNIRDKITEHIINESEKNYISNERKEKLIENVYNQLVKYGKIQKYLDDDKVSEIMINGKDKIFIETNGKMKQVDFSITDQELEDLIQKMVITMNRTVNQAVPIVDARLSDGSRVNVVLKPIALNGPIVTIRKFSKEVFNIEQLIDSGTITEEAAEFLKECVGKKYNIFVSGGTASGKTTLLNILSNFIKEDERVITIEDSAELKIKNVKNLVSLETRNKNSEGYGEITIRDLIRSSLRMRPDRIIVGEVRGKETLDMLQAMNTGHEGFSTGHANSAKDMLTRLESMVLMNYEIPIEAVRRQIASAIDVIIHMTKLRSGLRVVEEIVQVVDYSDGKYELNVLYGRDKNGKLVKKHDLIKAYRYEEILC